MRAKGRWRGVVDDNRAMVREGWQALHELDYTALLSTAFRLRYWCASPSLHRSSMLGAS